MRWKCSDIVEDISVEKNVECMTPLPCLNCSILGDPGAASRDDGIFMGESLQQERESPWALTDPVPEAFEFSPSDWPEKYFSGQSAKRNSRGDSHVFLHEVVFLINRRSSVARSTGTFLRRASEKKSKVKWPWPEVNKHSAGFFTKDLSKLS